MNSSAREPISVLIAALGGQGGGVLTGWIVHAARAQGLAVQATSTPGVSQRTGATSYYVEMAAPPLPGERAPTLGLAPVPARVDVLVCAELLEAARMVERGMCTPARTLVIASTHRVYTTHEKMSGDDGRFDDERVRDALQALARRTVLFDMEAVRTRHRAAISAPLFGALAGSGALPLSRSACEDAIRAADVGVKPSLAAFAEAFERAAAERQDAAARSAVPPQPAPVSVSDVAALSARADALPAPIAEVVRLGIAQLVAWQDARYASRYVERVERIARAALGRGGLAVEAACETARHLALWMAYDDLIEVAAAKSRASRFARIRQEVSAGDGDVVRVRDFFRPGVAEIAAVLPPVLGQWLERQAPQYPAGRPAQGSTGRGAGRSLTLETSTITGALALRLIVALRPLRPRSLRFAREQSAIEDWLALVEQALGAPEVALTLAKLPRLLGGYGETHATGRSSFERLIDGYRRAGGAQSPSAVSALTASAGAALIRAGCASGDGSEVAVAVNTVAEKTVARPVIWLQQR